MDITQFNGQFCTYASNGSYVCTTTLSWEIIYDLLRVDPVHYYQSSTWIVTGAKLILMGLFWLSTCCTGTDFTRSFLTSVAIPTTFSAVVDATQILFPMLGMGNLAYMGLGGWSMYADAIATYTFAGGSVFFILFVMRTAYKKKQVDSLTAFFCFYLTLLAVSLLMVGYEIVYVFFPEAGHEARRIGHQTCMIIALVSCGAHQVLAVFILLSICFCSGREHSSTDPVVVNSRRRLAWLLPYSQLVPLTVAPDFVGDMTDPYMAMAISLIMPPLIFLGCFLILPAYRSTIFCCCANLRASYPSTNQVVPENTNTITMEAGTNLPPIKYMVPYGYPPLPISHAPMAPPPMGYYPYYNPPVNAHIGYGFHPIA